MLSLSGFSSERHAGPVNRRVLENGTDHSEVGKNNPSCYDRYSREEPSLHLQTTLSLTRYTTDEDDELALADMPALVNMKSYWGTDARSPRRYVIAWVR